MAADSLRKSQNEIIVILSDHARLSRVIKRNLEVERRWNIVQLEYSAEKAERLRKEDEDRIACLIVAMSSTEHDPVRALSHSGLDALIDHVPLLIISNHSYTIPQARQIACLGFPFDPSRLQNLVKNMLPPDTVSE